MSTETLECVEDFDLGALIVTRTVEQRGKRADVVSAEDDIDERRLLDDGVTILLRQAPADRDLHVGVRLLVRGELAEVAVQLVVRVLADRTRVEDDKIRIGSGLRLRIPGVLEQTGQSLGIVDVHLTAVRPHLVGANRLRSRLRNCSRLRKCRGHFVDQ